jgi:hypothetical protein
MPTLPTPGADYNTWGLELNEWLSEGGIVHQVKEGYGAAGDGVADDTAAIQAAINACGAAGGGVVYLPTGTYRITSTLEITDSSVAFVGAGFSSNPGAPAQPVWAPATLLQWDGGADPVLLWEFVQGCRASDFAIDGGDTASHGLYVNSFQYGTLDRIGVRGTVADTGISCFMGAQVSDCNTQWCSFSDLFLDGSTCLYLTGNASLTHDVTTCVFRNLVCTYANTSGAAGIVVDFADGNDFFATYVYRKSGTGIGVELGGQARNNFFWHLYPHAGGLTARTPDSAGWANRAIFFSTQDGSPDEPTLEAGAVFDYWSYTADSTTDVFKTNALMRAPYLSLREQALRDGQGVAGETWPRQLGTGGNQPTAGAVYMSAVGLMRGDVVTNLLCIVNGAGSGTSLSKLALYDSDLNKVAATADQGSSWNTAGAKTAALTAPYTVTATGVFYIAVIVNAATTIPILWRVAPNDGIAPHDFAGGLTYLWGFDTSSGRTDFPSSMYASFTVAGAPCFWFGWS